MVCVRGYMYVYLMSHSLQEMLRLRVGLILNVMVLELSRAMNCTRKLSHDCHMMVVTLSHGSCRVYNLHSQRSRDRSSCWISTHMM